jgi:ribonucleotide monophosphatase NagD (HAD superfamily)
MVGDDVASDVVAAQEVGIRGVLVRTGKYLPGDQEKAARPPDHVLGSFADLPDLIEELNA